MSFTFVLTRRISHISNYLVPRKHIQGLNVNPAVKEDFELEKCSTANHQLVILSLEAMHAKVDFLRNKFITQ